MIYLDYASATPVRKDVLEAMLPFFSTKFANPSSIHSFGQKAHEAMESARTSIATHLNANPSEIIFTGSGTESINLAILGYVLSHKAEKKHIIISSIEHDAVSKTCFFLEKNHNVDLTILPVTKNGFIDPVQVKKALRPHTILVSIIYANNEIGTIQNLSKIGQILKKRKIIFHTDACQAGSLLSLDVKKLGVDMLSLNASKMYGPKGVGALYVRSSIYLQPLIYGGEQENGFRSGTENVSAIVGFAKALDLAHKEKTKEWKRFFLLQKYFLKLLKNNLSSISLNGSLENRLPNNVNISIEGVDSETLINYLSTENIFVSSGSACHAQTQEPSHVLLALGLSEAYVRSSIRFTFGKDTTKKDLKKVVQKLSSIVNSLRKIS